MRAALLCVLLMGSTNACGGRNTDPQGGRTAPGEDRTAKTAALETGANLVQSKAPIEKISMYLNGFHAARSDPNMQMESHHYCDQVNEDFAQCALYDGNTADSRLHGVEYIVSEKLYNGLPAGEKGYWHPHNFEILSGQLRMPGLPDVAEKEALKKKVNSTRYAHESQHRRGTQRSRRSHSSDEAARRGRRNERHVSEGVSGACRCGR